MNDKTGASRGLRRAAALAVVAAAAALTAACGSSPASSGDPAATSSATFRAELAFAHCMQTHGMPNFPDPTNANQGFGVSGQLNGTANGPAGQAHSTCQHLLPRGGSTSSGGGVTQTQINEALKIVQCLRAHGEPTFPDPTVSNGSLHITVKPGVLQSSQFQTALNACRSLIPKGVKFP
jgi:hypothetical protein